MRWLWCEADVDCRRGRWQIHLESSWGCGRTRREPKTTFPLVFFFSISDKGWKRRKGKEKETCNRATTNNLALILTRVIFFGVPADAPYVLQPLKIISTVDLLSWLLYNKNWLQETGRHLSPVGEGEEFGRYRYYNGHNRCHKHKDCRANSCLAKSSLIDQIDGFLGLFNCFLLSSQERFEGF